MFSLNVIISHKKLLKKSESINEKEILDSIIPIIKKSGGVLSEYSKYFSYFPSLYEYSKESFIVCLQNLHESLSRFHELIGFSIIIDSYEPQSEFEYSEISNRLYLKTNDIDNIWFTDSAYELVSDIIDCTNCGTLNMVSSNFLSLTFKGNELIKRYIDNKVQFIFDYKKESVVYFDSDMNIALYRNLTYWADLNGYDQVLYLDLSSSPDKILTFIDFIISLKNIFDPTLDLTEDEILNWGRYLDLYKSFYKRSYDCFILDDSDIHFNNLIMLWAESFSKKFKTLFIIKYVEDTKDIETLWSITSLFNNIKLFIFKSKLKKNKFKTNLPDLLKLEDLLDEGIEGYLDKKSDDSLMILYISLLTGGSIPKDDLLYILNVLDFNILTLIEELDNYKRLGFLLGDNHLYPGSVKIIPAILNIRSDKVSVWKNNFLKAFVKVGYHKIFSYSYVFSTLAINSDFRIEALDVLYHYIQKTLDLGRFVTFSNNFDDEVINDHSLQNILEYKKIRESRINGSVDTLVAETVNDDHQMFDVPLEYLNLLNIWSCNSDGNLIDRCKKLYFNYQSNGENFNESRIKTLFSLALLSIGSVSEAVDYFDLNCSFSKKISDTLGYLRNGCFHCAALYIKGDVSGVLRVSELLLKHDWIFFKSKWLLYLKFIRVRALIELGYYSEALENLEAGILLAKKFSYEDIKTVYVNWKGRVLYYLGREGDAREVILSNEDSNEGFFFLSEIEYYSGNIDRAIFYIDKVDLTLDDNILFDEHLKWRDGFFLIEEFFNRSNRSSVLFQEIKYFNYMLKIQNGNKEALKDYYTIISSISNNSIGVHDHRYIYYLYIATNNMDVHEDFNRDNLLNKVTRLLQQRASNITAHNQKHFYLDNFYNRPIIEISRSKKLF